MERLILALLLTGAAAHAAAITNLGAAGSFNMFILGDHTPGNTDAGRIAVMGNAVYTPFTVAQANGNTPIPSSGNNLVVGGNLTWTDGSTGAGDVWVGGNANITRVGGLNNVAVNGNLAVQNETINGTLTVGGTFQNNGGVGGPYSVVNGSTDAPVDFAAEKAYLEAASQYWGTLGGAVTIDQPDPNWTRYQTLTGVTLSNIWNDELQLTGSDENLNVFYIPSFDRPLRSININVPEGSTVLINSGATNVQFLNGQVSLSGGADANNIVFNFYKAVSITMSGYGGQGSILAPNAGYNGTYGSWNGSIVAKAVSGTTEFHNYLFEGNLPGVPVETPEPSTFMLGAGGLAAAWAFRRRRQA